MFASMFLTSITSLKVKSSIFIIVHDLKFECGHIVVLWPVYHAVYLEVLTLQHFKAKLAAIFSIKPTQISQVFVQQDNTPEGMHILVKDSVSKLHCAQRQMWVGYSVS